MRAERLSEIVALLRRHPRLTAEQLAGHLGVSRRTALRDLDALSLAGVPVYAERGRNGGYALLPGYREEPTRLTEAELGALLLPGGEAMAAAVGRAADFRSARRKLESVLSDSAVQAVHELSSWMLVVPEGWREPLPPSPMLPPLADACLNHQVVELEYADADGKTSRRLVRPLGLVLAGQHWYLLAHRDDTAAARTYRVSRVRGVTATSRRFRPHVGLVEAWSAARASFADAPAERVLVRAAPGHLPVVRYVASLCGTVQAEQPDGERTLVTIAVTRLPAAAGLLCGIAGERCEVLEPAALLEQIRDLSLRNLERYGR